MLLPKPKQEVKKLFDGLRVGLSLMLHKVLWLIAQCLTAPSTPKPSSL